MMSCELLIRVGEIYFSHGFLFVSASLQTFVPMAIYRENLSARMAELVDALASGASLRKGVGVRVPLRAPLGSFSSAG